MPTVIPWANDSTSPAPAPARSSTASTAAITPRDWSSGVVGAFAVCRRLAVVEDGVGERPADVDSEQHAGSLRGQVAARLAGDELLGGELFLG